MFIFPFCQKSSCISNAKKLVVLKLQLIGSSCFAILHRCLHLIGQSSTGDSQPAPLRRGFKALLRDQDRDDFLGVRPLDFHELFVGSTPPLHVPRASILESWVDPVDPMYAIESIWNTCPSFISSFGYYMLLCYIKSGLNHFLDRCFRSLHLWLPALGCFVYIYNLLVFITLELLVRCFEQGPNIFSQMVMNKFSIYHGIPIRKIDHL